MYRIRAKAGFNVVLKDIGIVLRAENRSWTPVLEETFNASKDAATLAKYIEIEGVEKAVEETVKVEEPVVPIQQTAEGAFVREGHVQTNPDDVFIAQPTTSPEALTKTVIQDEPAPVFVAQPPVDETPAKEEAPVFIANPAEVVEAKEVEAPAAKKPAAKAKSTSKKK